MRYGYTTDTENKRVLSLNPVKPKVRFDGEEFLFESLMLEQKMNSCHYFEVVKEFFSQDEMWQAKPGELIGMIGSRVLIYLEHLDGSHPYEFSGWVTDVQIDSWEDFAGRSDNRRRSNKVRIIGQGDVVKLDGAATMNSFVDCSLSSIVAQTTQDSRLEVKCNPKYKALLPYAMQYGESKFEFLNRLSYTYGELFFYDGRTLFFGTPDNPRSEDLYVDQDLTSLRTYSSAVPRKYIGYGYLPMEDQFVRTPECFKPNDKHWLIDTITKRSDYLFPDKGVVEAGTPAYHDSHIYDMADNRRSDAAGRMMNIEGETRTCRIKLGGLVNVFFPLKMDVPWLGQYRIIQIIHRVDKNGNYSNHFVAIPSQYEYVLERFMHKLVAYPEVATVSDNNDPKGQGRVKVQFYWQRPLSLSTNWLRVQTPDAGSSDKVSSNRGWVTIPEVGDQVMVGFEHGDPHRPFVMGSLFHGKSGIGGGVDNKNKSFSTKQGNYFRLNGSNGSVVLSTPLGAVFQRFDKDGNATIKAIKNHFVRAKEKASIEIIPQLPKGKDTPNDNTPPPSPSATFSLNNEGVIELSGNKSVTIKVGNSKITLSDGKVTIEGAKIDVKGEIEMN
ncbi:phage baseplate assembly protein V [Porphyromonas endodontalis]|uniref:phage baseplate assembly protein V n=1 Tax=Porphyromonas endodontalis TaxID=28124 RepID=UPI0028F05BED|nr:phage baseplate assembly protein V [Porphyromonas endodontalis]